MTTIPANAKKVATNGGYQWLAGNQAYEPPIAPCADVEVTDTDLTIHNVASGGSYVCTIPPPVAVVSTKTFTFGDGLLYDFIRIGFDATINLTAAVLVNVATVVYKINGATVTGAQSVVNGDALTITITKTSVLSAATVALEFAYSTDTEAITVPDYLYANWTNLAAMTVDTDTFLATNRGLLAGINGTDTFDKGANSVESFSGAFTVEIDSLTLGSLFGIATTNNSGASLNRPKYAWYCQANNLLQMRANGGFIATAVSVPRNNSMRYSLRIVDTGAAIEFWYKPPSGIWALNQTTTAGYSAGTTYYADIVSSIDAQKSVGVKIYP